MRRNWRWLFYQPQGRVRAKSIGKRRFSRLSDPEYALSIRDAAFSWEGGFGIEIAGFDLQARERVLLLGPSGGGKSTFLNLVAGITTPSRGQINVLGTDIARLRGARIDRYRVDSFGIIFQMFNLLPWLSAIDNVLVPLRFSSLRRKRVTDARGEAARLLGALGIDGSLFDQRAGTLSVGQQQRVAAARALIGGPGIILADEPTSALDSANARAFLDLLMAELETAQAALLMVSHDEALADAFDRVVRLDEIARVTGSVAA